MKFSLLRKIIVAFVTLVILNSSTIAPALAAIENDNSIPLDQLSQPTLVQEHRADLLQKGCIEVTPQGAEQRVAVPANTPVHVAARDWVVDRPMFCSQEVAQTLTPVSGEVHALWWCLGITFGITSPCVAHFIGLDPAQLFGTDSDTLILKIITGIFLTILELFTNLCVIILVFFSFVISRITFLGNFTTHPLVTSIAPLLLGFINFSFILGIIFIALRTVTAPGSYDFKKPLVKLLIAALLINFSLVICGVLIDASRLIMAIEMRLLAANGESISLLGQNILRETAIFNNTYQFVNTWFVAYNFARFEIPPDKILGTLVDVIFANIAIVSTTIMLAFLGVGLLVRYIALLLLCATAPVAFLGYIFENLHSSTTAKWWSYFMKYVVYGPLALFVIIFLARATTANVFRIRSPDTLFTDLFGIIALGFMYVLAARTAAKASSFGGDYLANFAKKHPLATTAVLTGGTSLVAAGAAKVATTGVKSGVQQVRDFADVGLKAVRRRAKETPYLKALIPAERDKDGKLKEGQQSFAQQQAKRLFGSTGVDPVLAKEYTEANAMKAAGRTAADITGPTANPIYNPNNLRQAHIGQVITKDQITAIVDFGSFAQKQKLLQSPDVVKKMDDAKKAEIMDLDIDTNTPVAATNRANKLNKQLQDALIKSEEILKKR